MSKPTIDERVRELREILELLDTPPGREAWNTRAVRHMPAILDELERQQLREFGRCREMGGGMLMVFDWHKTQEAAEAAIPEDSPVKQFVISREALNEHQ